VKQTTHSKTLSRQTDGLRLGVFIHSFFWNTKLLFFQKKGNKNVNSTNTQLKTANTQFIKFSRVKTQFHQKLSIFLIVLYAHNVITASNVQIITVKIC